MGMISCGRRAAGLVATNKFPANRKPHLKSQQTTPALVNMPTRAKTIINPSSYSIPLYTLPISPPPNPNLALKHTRPRRSIRLRPAVQVIRNPRIAPLIRARQTNTRRRLARTTPRDVDLRALHVELGAGVGAGGVEGDEFAAEEVLARSNAGRDGDGLFALVGDEAVDAPGGAVEGVFGDLVGAG
jgi:hypothetical protein